VATTAPAPPRRTVVALTRELVLLGMLLGVYTAARMLAGKDVPAAFGHAGRVLRLEQAMHLPSEQVLQAVLLSWRPLTHAANLYYAGAHLPVTLLALVWLFLRHREHYVWARRAIVSATAAALAVYVLVPVAPPRMLSGDGFVDTATLLGQSVYGSPTQGSLADQYAAMPSLHVGWAILVAVVGTAASRHRLRWLWPVHPLVTTFVVVSTGNHYWLDALAGALLVGGALMMTHRPSGLQQPAGAPARSPS
jgi:hypothetical protein